MKDALILALSFAFAFAILIWITILPSIGLLYRVGALR